MDSPYDDALIRFKRRIYVAALLFGLLALLVNGWIEVWQAETVGAEGWLVILLTLTCLLLLGGLYSRRISVATVENLLLLGVAASLFADLVYLLIIARLPRTEWLRNLADLLYWFPLVSYFLFVVRDRRWAMNFSLLYLGAVLCVEILYLLRLSGQADFTQDISLLGRFTMALVIYLLFGAVMARLRDLQEQSRIRGREMEILASNDYLTGILNRRIVEELINHEIARAGRVDNLFSIMLLDLDHFKEINDRFGHGAGDAALMAVARVIQEDMRAGDRLGRWGGDELLILSTGTDKAKAGRQADRLRELIRAETYPHGQSVTVSIGVAEFRHGDDSATLIARADAALYRAKAGGRDQIAVAD